MMLEPSKEPSVGEEFCIGAAAGLLDCCCFHWLDTAKVRRQDGRPLLMDLQTGGPLSVARAGGPLGFARASARSLYAGFSTNLSLKLPYMAIMFACNAANTQALRVLRDGPLAVPSAAEPAVAAALVGVEVSLMLAPLEMIRIQGQNCGAGGLLSATRAVAATAAPPGRAPQVAALLLSRGMGATMQRELKYCLGQFYLCGLIADAAAERMRATDGDGERVARDALAPQIAGAVAGGLLCTSVSHPDDVIKTRQQTHLRGSAKFDQYTGYVRAARSVVREEGVRALFRGAAFRCLLRVPLGLSLIMVSSGAMRARLCEAKKGQSS